MVLILICLTALLGLVTGCLLQQFEAQNEAFGTVPRAWFWIVSRLISLRDVPDEEGTVYSKAGISLLVLVMATKGVLMILPIARIKQIFVEEFSNVTEVATMRSDLWNELFHRTVEDDWTGHQGLTWGRVHLLDETGSVTKTAQFALPLFLGRSLRAPHMKVEFPHRFFDARPSVMVSIVWDEEALAARGTVVLPKGQLKLHLFDPHGIAATSVFRVDIPFQCFGYTSRRMELDEDHTFTIDWTLDGKELVPINADKRMERRPRSRMISGAADDPGNIMALLGEQSDLLHKIAATLKLGQTSDRAVALHAEKEITVT